MDKFKVGIIGATGYAGVELVRLLAGHPLVELTAVASQSFMGKPISEVYPSLYGLCDLICVSNEEVIAKSDVVFAAVPSGISQELAAECIQSKCVFIDLGADFRLDSEEDYAEWYGGSYKYPGLHEAAVYGLPELFRDQMPGRVIVGNPGCYPTASALALAPALREGLIEPQGIIIDAKSGVSGSGRSLTQASHFIDVNENFNAYKVGVHRHTPEIEQTLTRVLGSPVRLTFVPHLLPVSRGILATCYAKSTLPCSLKTLRNAYEKAYANEPFVRVLPEGKEACIRNVTMSNFCDISLHFCERSQTVIITSAIDNMIKGAAGQAVQNMNILLSMPETLGLEMIPSAF